MDTSPGTIDQSKDGDVWILGLRGEHDLNTAPELRDKLDDIYDSGSQVIVDPTDGDLVDSSIFNVLVYACERASQKAITRSRSSHRLTVWRIGSSIWSSAIECHASRLARSPSQRLDKVNRSSD